MRIFKTKPFARFASREKIADAALIDAVRAAITAALANGTIVEVKDHDEAL